MILEDYIHQSLEDLSEFKITVEETTTFKFSEKQPAARLNF